MNPNAKKKNADSERGLGSQGRTHNTKKRRSRKIISEATKQGTLLEYYEAPPNELMASVFQSLRDKMPGHFQLGLWQRDPRMLSRHHLPAFLKILELDPNDATMNESTRYINTRRNNKQEILIDLYSSIENGGRQKSQAVKMDQSPIVLSIQDLCFYIMRYSQFVAKFSAHFSKEQLFKIFQSLAIYPENSVQLGEIYWPAVSLAPLNHNFSGLRSYYSNFTMNEKATLDFLQKVLSSCPNLPKYESMKSEIEPSEQIQQNEEKRKDQFQRIEPDDLAMLKKKISINNSEEIRQNDSLMEEEQARSSLMTPIAGEVSKQKGQQSLEEELEFKPVQTVITEKSLFIWFIGTSTYIDSNKNIASWSMIGQNRRKKIFSSTKFSLLIEDMNKVMHYFGNQKKFSKAQPRVDECKAFLYRLGEYKEQNQIFFCLPLRFQNVKGSGNKKILIKIFKQNSTQLKWVPLQTVTVNYLFPNLKVEETALLYLTNRVSPLEIFKEYIFRPFFFIEQDYTEIFLSYYPRFHIDQKDAFHNRCTYCHYMIRQQSFRCCFFCKQFYHRSCAITREKYFAARPGILPENEDIWICQSCEPCFICNEAVGSKFFKCSVCKNYLHQICGRLRGIEEDNRQFNELGEKFVCESCLKCRMCSKKLRDTDYEINNKSFFCSECNEKIMSNDHCHICMKQKDGKWTQCDNQDCLKWIHDACDIEYQLNYNTERDRYLCPMCRLKIKRNVYSQLIFFLSQFDELQFFTDATYEKIPFYDQVISHPMCFSKMREFAQAGDYDDDPFKKIEAHFQLIVKNALEFNMPKDPAHFYAKVLKVNGEIFLQRFKECFMPNIKDLLTGHIFNTIKDLRTDFYRYLYDNFPEVLINYKWRKSYIQIKKKPSLLANPEELGFSSSRLFNEFQHNINNRNVSVFFHLKKEKMKIANLFSMPPNEDQRGNWSPIKGDQCFYHENSEIIFSCDQCCESFCCMTQCLKHRVCSCGVRGCRCDNYECGCPPLKEKEKKVLEAKIIQKYADSVKSYRKIIMDATENYKYCFRCVMDKPMNRTCFICLGLCSWGYSRCPSCQRCWHKICNHYAVPTTYIPTNNGKGEQNWNGNGRVSSYGHTFTCSMQYCKECLEMTENLNVYEQTLTLETKAKLIKMDKVHRYLRFFAEIYFHEGIRMTLYEIQLLILDNFDQFSIREQLFKDYELNYLIMERFRNVTFKTNAAIDRSFNQYINDYLEVRKKQNNIKETPRLRTRILGNEFCTVLEELEDKDARAPAFDFQDSHEYLNNCKRLWWKYMKFQHIDYENVDPQTFYDWKKAKLTLEFPRRKFILLKMKKVRARIIEEAYKYKDFNTHRNEKMQIKQKILYQEESCIQEMRNNEMVPQNEENEKDHREDEKKYIEKYTAFSDVKEYRSYLQSLSYISTIKESFYKKEHHYRFTICYKPRIMPYEYNLNPMFNKKHKLASQIKEFLLGIYQESKFCLRKGSTCILKNERQAWVWEILKQWGKGRKKLHVVLKKRNDMWDLVLNGKRTLVAEIEDIIRELNNYVEHNGREEKKLRTFKDVAEFLGFTIQQPFEKANHFTYFLQNNLVAEMPLLERMKRITDLFNSFIWLENGIFQRYVLHEQSKEDPEKNKPFRYEYAMTKKKPFYLTKNKKPPKIRSVKRNISTTDDELHHQHQAKNEKQSFITFQDLNRHLYDQSSLGIAQAANSKSEISLKNNPILSEVFIAPSKIHKLGLFARRSVKKNTIMIEYMGQIVSESVADKREQKFHYGCYMFGLGKHIQEKKDIIDATFRGNMARYLNHSCDPNCKAKTEFVGGSPRIFIYTVRDIDQFEQLTYDYQFNVDGDQKLPCTCKAKNCQGFLN